MLTFENPEGGGTGLTSADCFAPITLAFGTLCAVTKQQYTSSGCPRTPPAVIGSPGEGAERVQHGAGCPERPDAPIPLQTPSGQVRLSQISNSPEHVRNGPAACGSALRASV